MLKNIYASKTIGITDLKRSDTAFIDELNEPVAILKRDNVKAYLIPEKLMQYFVEQLENIELAEIANKRLNDLDNNLTSTLAVDINDL